MWVRFRPGRATGLVVPAVELRAGAAPTTCFDEERDFADQDPLSDMDMEEDAQNLATLLNHIPSCMNADVLQHVRAH